MGENSIGKFWGQQGHSASGGRSQWKTAGRRKGGSQVDWSLQLTGECNLDSWETGAPGQS